MSLQLPTVHTRYSVDRPFKAGWQTVIQIATFEAAVAEARRGCRYAKQNKIVDDEDRLVTITQQIFLDDAWVNWHGWRMHTETDVLDVHEPQTHTDRAWAVHEAEKAAEA